VHSFLTSERLHLRRKLQHASSALLILFLYVRVTTRMQAWMLLLGSAAIVWTAHRIRLAVPAVQRFVLQSFGTLLRPHEVQHLPGAFWLLLGSGLSILLFAPMDQSRGTQCAFAGSELVDAPALALVFCALGDPLAGAIGLWLSEQRRKQVTIVGQKSRTASIIAAVICLPLAVLLVHVQRTQTMQNMQADMCSPVALLSSEQACSEQRWVFHVHSWLWAAIAVGVGAACEFGTPLLDFDRLDDNLRVPLGTALVLWLIKQTGALQQPLTQPSCDVFL
jgi:dolichol kinase